MSLPPSLFHRALRLCDLFGYIVSFTGVGSPADSHTNVGFCSQIAVFNRDPSRQDSALQCRSREEPTVYRLVWMYLDQTDLVSADTN